MSGLTTSAFNPEEPVVAHFEEVLFPFPTGITQKTGAKTKMTELVRTADRLSGTIDVDKLEADRMDERLLARDRGRPSPRGYVLAAWIRGEAEPTAGAEGEEKPKTIEVKPTAACRWSPRSCLFSHGNPPYGIGSPDAQGQLTGRSAATAAAAPDTV